MLLCNIIHLMFLGFCSFLSTLHSRIQDEEKEERKSEEREKLSLDEKHAKVGARHGFDVQLEKGIFFSWVVFPRAGYLINF